MEYNRRELSYQEQDTKGRNDANPDTMLRYCLNDGAILFLHTPETDCPENPVGISGGLRGDFCLYFTGRFLDWRDRIPACAVGDVCKVCGKDLSGLFTRGGAQCIVLYVR